MMPTNTIIMSVGLHINSLGTGLFGICGVGVASKSEATCKYVPMSDLFRIIANARHSQKFVKNLRDTDSAEFEVKRTVSGCSGSMLMRMKGKDAESEEMRCLRCEIDLAVRDSYGWQDVDLEYSFLEVENLPANGNICYTISEPANVEIFKCLANLNKESWEEEGKCWTA